MCKFSTHIILYTIKQTVNRMLSINRYDFCPLKSDRKAERPFILRRNNRTHRIIEKSGGTNPSVAKLEIESNCSKLCMTLRCTIPPRWRVLRGHENKFHTKKNQPSSDHLVCRTFGKKTTGPNRYLRIDSSNAPRHGSALWWKLRKFD